MELENDNRIDELFEEFKALGYKVDVIPITLDGKSYDFTYHTELQEAHEFCKSLGYVVNPYLPQEACWSGEVFRLK